MGHVVGMDARLTSVLILFFLYLGYMALKRLRRSDPGAPKPGRSWCWSAWSMCRSSSFRSIGGIRCTSPPASSASRTYPVPAHALAAVDDGPCLHRVFRDGRPGARAQRNRRPQDPDPAPDPGAEGTLSRASPGCQMLGSNDRKLGRDAYRPPPITAAARTPSPATAAAVASGCMAADV